MLGTHEKTVFILKHAFCLMLRPLLTIYYTFSVFAVLWYLRWNEAQFNMSNAFKTSWFAAFLIILQE